MSISEEALEILLPSEDSGSDKWAWGTVTSVSPLRVRLDGEVSALALTPDPLVYGLAIGDRVRIHLSGKRAVIAGRAGGSPELATLSQLPNPNLIINGRFRTNQRGYVSATDVASGIYGVDRWKATTANSRMTFTANANQGQQVTIASGDSWAQDVERSSIDPGQHVLSWEGTAQARVYNVGASAPSYASSPISVTLDGAAHVRVEFGPGTVDRVKLERGTAATPFVLDTEEQEVLKCWRYYYRIAADNGDYCHLANAAAYSTSAHYGGVRFPAPMRAAPTGSYSSSAAVLVLYQGVSIASASILFAQATKRDCRVACTTGGSVAAGYSSWFQVFSGHWIAFDAEM